MQYYVDRYGNVVTRKEYAEITGQQPRETQKTAEEKHEQKKEEGR